MSDFAGTCSNCGAPLKPGARFCERCGTPVAAQEIVHPSWKPPAILGFSPASEMPAYDGNDPLLSYDVDYPRSLSRWKIFVKWLLSIPHWIILYFLGIAVAVVWVIAWFAILITGRYPRGIFDLVTGAYRWLYRITAYIYLMTDRCPPFSLE